MNNRYQNTMSDLQELGSTLMPSEAQGVLIGMWLGAGRASESQWLQELVDEPATLAIPANLRALYSDLVNQMTTADSFGLDLLLPDDDAPFQTRLTALIEFSQSVLYGYAVAKGPSPQHLAEDVREVFDDLQAIASLDDQADGSGDDEADDEINLQEIIDYLSAALIVMYIGMHPPVPTTESTLRQH